MVVTGFFAQCVSEIDTSLFHNFFSMNSLVEECPGFVLLR